MGMVNSYRILDNISSEYVLNTISVIASSPRCYAPQGALLFSVQKDILTHTVVEPKGNTTVPQLWMSYMSHYMNIYIYILYMYVYVYVCVVSWITGLLHSDGFVALKIGMWTFIRNILYWNKTNYLWQIICSVTKSVRNGDTSQGLAFANLAWKLRLEPWYDT